jgi:hypothetical protein
LWFYLGAGVQWQSLGGVITSDVSCVSWGPNRIDCFARGTDFAMWHRWWNGGALSTGGGWRGWETLGGNIWSAPECVSWGVDRIDCFALGSDNLMWHRWWRAGPSWGEWERPGTGQTPLEGNISCTTWSAGGNRIDCFALSRGRTRNLMHVAWDGRAWRAWESLGSVPPNGIGTWPNCISRMVNRIDCFVTATNLVAWRRQWNGSRWLNWENLGGRILGSPKCVAYSEIRIDCFAVGGDRTLQHRWWNGSTWAP